MLLMPPSAWTKMQFALRNMTLLPSFKRMNLLVETVLMKTTIPEASANNSSSIQKSFYESDEDIPYFSDVEAVILDMDLSPNGQDMYCSKRVKEYQRPRFY
ncbi:hypothetical protein HAX54_011289 [Datura stramonium]|uniref:Uncharacterized protein n=1 Tax=Datura stramonium TaxID=4076 RepID=A0ABS8Y4W4_DATST|nr:hypothetical protein [Datura stramonium]